MPLSDEEKDAPDRVVATRKRTEMKHFSQVAFAET